MCVPTGRNFLKLSNALFPRKISNKKKFSIVIRRGSIRVNSRPPTHSIGCTPYTTSRVIRVRNRINSLFQNEFDRVKLTFQNTRLTMSGREHISIYIYINYPVRFVGTGGIRRERVPAGDVFQRVVVNRHRSRSFRRHCVADARPARRFRRENRAAQSGPDRRGVQVASEWKTGFEIGKIAVRFCMKPITFQRYNVNCRRGFFRFCIHVLKKIQKAVSNRNAWTIHTNKTRVLILNVVPDEVLYNESCWNKDCLIVGFFYIRFDRYSAFSCPCALICSLLIHRNDPRRAVIYC